MKKITIISLLIFCASLAFSQDKSSLRSSFFPVLKDGSPVAHVTFTQPKQNVGLGMVNPDGSGYASDTVLGKKGVTPSEDSKDSFLYFQTASDQLVLATGTFFVTVQYYDKGQGAISLEYQYLDKNNEKQPRGERMFLSDSGYWQQHTFNLVGAVFDQSLEGGSDFRINCPGVLIHSVMLTRVPIGNKNQAGPLFRHKGITPPMGYEFGVILRNDKVDTIWEKDDVFETKTLLYNAWGVSNVIETVNAALVQTPQNEFNFSLYNERREKLSDNGLVWTPRFKIGDINDLPLNIVNSLQMAVGTGRPEEGPMVSMWDPALVDVYKNIFSAMRRSMYSTQLPKIILSFSGDWGPLNYSFDSSGRKGWPDFWAGDPIAQRSFNAYLQRRYGNMIAARSAWRDKNANFSNILPVISSEFNPQRLIDTYSWYRESMTALVRQIAQNVRMQFPQTSIVLEIADDFEYGATDPYSLASLAAELNASIIMTTNEENPTKSALWQLFAFECKRHNVKYGLRTIGNNHGEAVLSALYSLCSEGGSIFYFPEDLMAGKNAWNYYADSIGRLQSVASQPYVAVVFPSTSLTVDPTIPFLRLAGELRDFFGFDVVDERSLGSISTLDHPLIFSPCGSIWDAKAISDFERLARSGAALVAYTNDPWMTPGGDVDFNERLFAVQLEKGANGWRMLPRKQSVQPYGNNNPIARVDKRDLSIGSEGDDMFLDGQWGESQNEMTANSFGFPFTSFRWMGERGNINLPMLPGKDYMLQIEGFIPERKAVQLYLNGEHLGGIRGNGLFRWQKPITGKLRARNGDVNLLMRGQLWSPGRVLGATQTHRVSMALSNVKIVPIGEKPDNVKQETVDFRDPDFQRKTLRGSWMREIGQGATVIAPAEHVKEWIFREMLNAILMHPSMLSSRFKFSLPPDGKRNGVFVKPLLGGKAAYLNLNSQPIRVESLDQRVRSKEIPPKVLYYTN